ncbi:MAG: ABC transporter ATP-binding protein [Synechococcaceae bacterium WBA_2_066]|nr:ABC transporter ATP-binding protein [Synechococcaceae bacterium WB6_1A_059]NBY59716.1 ABC transporter ATP-binding protein [Synechococcaceae bacterium LLD_019]NCU76105.1 ABC transporter ATP-binding protein [Synechococcaceae bacterium WB7_1C_051]NCY13471.1 ABC transporter ATP-binding protein [Synechococcaceae bacterium WB8_1A_041]NDC06174.1 ABC transporter ATP-binding protein [Synechococcaceae bacterium WB9_2_069]NDE37323.1 ABC transporter ATP-binding protein [Synechococcaceae bacterium WBA_2
MAEVEFQNLRKQYPPRRGASAVEVLRGIDLQIKDGEFLVLVGPSGCGKSTLLRLLAGLETPSAGEVLVGGRTVTNLPPSRRDVAMVFQSYALYPHLSVAQNIAFGLRRSGHRGWQQQLRDWLARNTAFVRSPREQAITKQVQHVAEMLNLGPLLDRLPKELSGGQKQRVALGRAIAREPAVFLMDEPLSNLDAKLRGDTRRQIVELQRSLGVTTVYVTHDQVEAMTMGHRIAVLNGGCLQQLGTPMELYQKPANLFVAQFIGSPPMNLLKVEVVSAEQVLLGGRRITLEPAAAGLLHNYLGKQLTAGLRPEKLRLAPATNRNLPAEVEQIEALGNEVLVAAVLQESGEKVQFRALPAAALQLGQVIHLEVDASGWSLFDADGLALGQVL